MSIRAVLFDLDGTLIDSYAAITASVNHVRAHYGLTPLTTEQVRPNIGRGMPHLIRTCIPGAEAGVADRLYREHHPSVLASGTRLLPGAFAALQALHARRLKLALCSNKPVAFTRTLLQVLQIGSFIDLALGPEDVAAPKPAPDIIQAALRAFKIEPADAIYVGDMTIDISTARAAGVRVWVVPTGSDARSTLAAAGPDQLLDDLHGLPQLIDNEQSAGNRA
jgi:phosphoglycolate phosphatase